VTAPAGLALSGPGWPEWAAPADCRRIDLLSDVHLHPGMPRTFEAWRQHLLGTPADVVLMLGDLFELWVGDDARHGHFEAQCLQVLKQASQQRVLAFLPGNRDFLLGEAMAAEAGVQRLADPTVLLAFGQRWLLSHGDALCLADHDYQRFRAQVRNPEWQRAFLAQPLSQRQTQARAMRDASTQRQAGLAPDAHSEVDNHAASAWLQQAGAAVLVHGHTHRPGRHDLPGGGQRLVLGDWDLDQPPYRARCLRLDSQGLHPFDLAAAA
jgi:UDP-2,3-diacylglucosamine hydrolase